MHHPQQIKPFSEVMKRKLILLRALTKSGRFMLQQLPLQRIQFKLHLAFRWIEEAHGSPIGGGIRCYCGIETLCLVVLNTEMHIHRDFHRHGEVVGAIEEGFGYLGRHGRIVSLVHTIIKVLAIVAHGMIGTLYITHVVVAECNFVRHQDKVETVVEAPAGETFVRITSC